ncbi:D-erythronate dehydrogenase [Chromohalobacter israelensis]|uniref:D-erythronate dehydrogenase n=1 Tax=Chromohalobacter israelensis TaxID=141390 RepID=UPI003AF4AD95
MHVLITGAAGFLGQRLIAALLDRGRLDGQVLTRLTLIDRAAPALESLSNDAIDVECRDLDIAEPGALNASLGERPDVIFHLAAVVSAEAEADLDLGMTVNFDATRALLEGCRRYALSATRLVMTSSVAVYGGELPEVLDDMTALTPQSSYGTQKAMCELLISDYSRRGLIDGRVLRLPTIMIRPGRPNAAASSFASSILREPLGGETAICPVSTELEMFVMSPGKVVAALIHGAEVPGDDFGASRSVMLPGLTVSVAEMLEALRRHGGEQALARVEHHHNKDIETIVASWPARFRTDKAKRLGFAGDDDFREIVESHLRERAASM